LTRAALLAAIALLFPAQAARGACAAPKASHAYTARVEAALSSRADLWGSQLLHSPGGPTYAGANRHLAPLLYARTSGGRPLTRSGVYYLPFSEPGGPQGAGSVELHVADGSEIRSDRVDGPGVAISAGGAPFGSCLTRLATPRLSGGWLPILELHYGDYRQESFAARAAGTLASFVHVTGPGAIALTPTVAGLRRAGDRLVRGGRTYLAFDGDASWNGHSLTFRGGNVYAAWFDHPADTAPQVDAEAYATARASVGAYWRGRLSEGAQLEVPETRVMDAERALIVQNLGLSWRYSIGNPYEEFSFPESLDEAQVLAELGFFPESRTTLQVSFTRKPRPYPSWTMGEKLLASAVYARLSGDRRFLARATPTLSGYVAALRRRQEGSGLLAPERFSSDIPDAVQGLHAQAVAWQGLLAIASVWAGAGRPGYAADARRVAGRLGSALRRAVASSSRRLPDGSLFLPMRLGAGEAPYDTVTESREGSYWNLVAPYALASGLFPPGSRAATGALAYLERHGSLLLGLVRAGGYSLYGPGASPQMSGTDEVYGVNLARFLAAQDDADELVLALYGQLAAAMTPNTFVAGEAASVAPLDGLRYRAMYLPPNSVANDSFLETLRLMLVQETAAGLRLGFATPRAWLRAGRRIAVSGVPTAFGPLSYSLTASAHEVAVHIEIPRGAGARTIKLRLRLPAGTRILRLSAPYRFDRATSTIELPSRAGPLDFVARIS
jgi:hypothetical protein